MTTYVWFVRGAQHAAMCRTSMEAAYKADKWGRRVVVSDDKETHALDEYAEGHLTIPAGMPIMVANIEAQLTALIEGADDYYVFLDTDVLLLKSIPQVGELTVTWRDHVAVTEEGEKVAGIAGAMPYNYGVMCVKRCKATIEAFMWLRERVRRMHPQQQKWYGNQLAMTELAGPAPKVGTQIDVRRIPWQLANPSTFLSVGKIPCELYNYTPRVAHSEVKNQHALHFKGHSRGLMEGYAKALGLGWYL